ncbi:uncharacterized protein RCO7_03568 [Rhynchosporium graminicola]|uniref:Uncharacterized protein n=1 Tax=Rhynchosporium graminicola TaxID=2792576 RepID=A0A1E1LK00_9HELO|nr:uncharacterized protein RCO7_03568 [Rhynchosporium commune]
MDFRIGVLASRLFLEIMVCFVAIEIRAVFFVWGFLYCPHGMNAVYDNQIFALVWAVWIQFGRDRTLASLPTTLKSCYFLGTQRRRRTKRSIKDNPASIPTIFIRSRPKLIIYLTIPLEIRFEIFSMIASRSHTITIAPGVCIASTDDSPDSEPAMPNPKQKSSNGEDEFHEAPPIAFRSGGRRSVPRPYGPKEAQQKIVTLECWNRAMRKAMVACFTDTPALVRMSAALSGL